MLDSARNNPAPTDGIRDRSEHPDRLVSAEVRHHGTRSSPEGGRRAGAPGSDRAKVLRRLRGLRHSSELRGVCTFAHRSVPAIRAAHDAVAGARCDRARMAAAVCDPGAARGEGKGRPSSPPWLGGASDRGAPGCVWVLHDDRRGLSRLGSQWRRHQVRHRARIAPIDRGGKHRGRLGSARRGDRLQSPGRRSHCSGIARSFTSA